MGPAGVEMVKKKVRSYSKQMEGPPARHIHIHIYPYVHLLSTRCYSITQLSFMLSGLFLFIVKNDRFDPRQLLQQSGDLSISRHIL